MAATVTNPPLAVNGFGAPNFVEPADASRPGSRRAAARAAPTSASQRLRRRHSTASGGPGYGADFGGHRADETPSRGPGTRGNAGRDGGAHPPEPRRKASSRGPSLVLVLLLALGVAGAVVGGVYVANQYAKVEDHARSPIPIPPLRR